MGRMIYKVLTSEQWAVAESGGPVQAPVDVKDGYVHFSTNHQLQGTLDKWFKGKQDCVLASFDADDFGLSLKWEKARGEFFPHVYGDVRAWQVRSLWLLEVGKNGAPLAPDEVVRRRETVSADAKAGPEFVTLFDLAAGAVRMLPAESAHRFTINALKTGLARPQPELDDPRLVVRLKRSGLTLPNPIGLAAGFDKNAEVIAPMLGFGFGFVECGTVTPRPQAGNPRPRLFRLEEDQAVINRMGFNNDGLGLFVRRLSATRGLGVIGANVGANKDSGDRIADYVAGVRAVWPHCSYITVNISSPNTPGLRGLQDRGALEELLGRVGAAARELETVVMGRPVFLKVAPDLDDNAIADIADVVKQQDWLAGLIVSNTTIDRPGSLTSRLKVQTGGLSGAR